VAVLIPSIDLMGGKIVQLIHGEQKALEFEDFNCWIERFSSFALTQLIDLDAAMGNGNNHELIATICRRLPCQIGGGVRSIDRARELLAMGARRVILGSSLVKDGVVNLELAASCSAAIGAGYLTFAIDSRDGKVAIKGWKEITDIEPLQMMRSLEPYCSAFLYTHIDVEGTMAGFPLETARTLRQATSRQLIVAGGIRSHEEVAELDALAIDSVVGMAIYTGALKTER
jgi:phosphoribosylformimino-5-aminoimidazole carboxamide ribotide isomerase